MFLNSIGTRAYELLRSLLTPTLPQTLDYTELVGLLREHYEPQPLVIAEGFHFHRCNQRETESISEYVAELRRLSTHCDFKSYLSEALRDRLVCGLCSDSIQRSLLAQKDLTLQKAVEIAQGMEAADSNAKSLKETSSAVFKVHAQKGAARGASTPRHQASNNSSNPCYCCGRTNHDQRNCRFRGATCHHYQKKGLIATVCRSKKNANGQQKHFKHLSHQANFVNAHSTTTRDDSVSGDSTENIIRIARVDEPSAQPFKAELNVNGKSLSMEFDTGASVSIISEESRKRHFPEATVETSSVRLQTYTGENICVV